MKLIIILFSMYSMLLNTAFGLSSQTSKCKDIDQLAIKVYKKFIRIHNDRNLNH